MGLRWHTGASEVIGLERPKQAPEARRTPSAALELISRLGPRLRDTEIVAELAAVGITTASGRPFDAAAVRWVRHVHKIPSPFTVPFGDGEISVNGYWTVGSARGHDAAATRLGSVSGWALRHLGPARLELYIEPWNAGSVRTAERVGYRREGLLRAQRTIAGERRDMELYALLPGDLY